MNDNIFYNNRAIIYGISIDNKVPVDVAADIWRRSNGIGENESAADYKAFLDELRRVQLDPKKTLADFFC